MSEESYEERQKRINRERQQRFRSKNKARLAEERAKDREIVRNYKNQHQPVPPASAPEVQPQDIVLHKDKRRTIKVKKTIFTEDVVIQKLRDYQPMKSETTREQYIRDAKGLFRVTGCPDLGGCLKNFEKIKHEIETARQKKDPTKTYGVNQKKQFIQSIVWLLTHFEIKIEPETRQKYDEYFAIYKQLSLELGKEKIEKKERGGGAVDSVNTILKKVEDKFGESSKQYMIASFYKFAPMRDDFAGLVVIPSIRNNDNSKMNYCIVPRQEKQKCTLVIQKYKTDKLYGILKFQLDNKTSTLLRNYIKKRKVQYDGKLFPEYKKDAMSSYISGFMKKVGYLGEGGINYLRHAVVTEEFKDHENLTAEEKVKLSRRLAHSVVAQYQYLRQIADP